MLEREGGFVLASDEAGEAEAHVGEEGFDVGCGALDFEEDGAVGLVANETDEGAAGSNGVGAGTKADALDAAGVAHAAAFEAGEGGVRVGGHGCSWKGRG